MAINCVPVADIAPQELGAVIVLKIEGDPEEARRELAAALANHTKTIAIEMLEINAPGEGDDPTVLYRSDYDGFLPVDE